MKKIALALTLTSIFALASCESNPFSSDDESAAKPAATGDKATTDSPTPQRGQPAGSSAGDANAGAFWTENARGGYMTKEQAMGYKSKDGKPIDWTKLDADADGRISQTEWNAYHGAAGRPGK
ncbi:MAG: hypothetical protein ACREV9_00280 [Burkholderiales bacterium]